MTDEEIANRHAGGNVDHLGSKGDEGSARGDLTVVVAPPADDSIVDRRAADIHSHAQALDRREPQLHGCTLGRRIPQIVTEKRAGPPAPDTARLVERAR